MNHLIHHENLAKIQANLTPPLAKAKAKPKKIFPILLI
jgi:hypothetical protein